MKLNSEPKPKEKAAAITTETETKTSPKSSSEANIVFLKGNEEKESCWNCYKLFVKSKGYVDALTKKVILLY